MPLTKTNYLAYQQCPKQLWLSIYQKELVDPKTARRFRIGNEVDDQARAEFPNGRFIAQASAPQRTTEAIAEGAETLFQATFAYNDLLVRTDIFTRLDNGGWHLIEVKSTSRYDPQKHLADVAFQLYVIQEAGLDVQQVSLMHLNQACEAPYLDNLFTLTDVTAEAEAMLPQIEEEIEQMRALMTQTAVPDEFIGKQCQNPYPCPFSTHCWESIEGVTVYNIPYLKEREQTLRAQKIVHLADLPHDMQLTASQKQFVSLHLEERVEVDRAAIAHDLSQLEYPLHFFDFETINWAIPRYDGCRPFQQVPFQYSCHLLHEDGTLEHTEFLHLGDDDPRPYLLEQLRADIRPEGHIVVYFKSFESSRLRELATAFPAYQQFLYDMVDRLWDQLDTFKNHYHHYQFRGSNSLKSVLSVLIPDLSYEELVVQNGEGVQETWEKLLRSEDSLFRETAEKALRAYCQLDTLAMVRIHQYLLTLG